MTLAAERGVDWAEHGDRRGRTAGPRRSWASPQPFEPRPRLTTRVSRTRWRDVVPVYQGRAIALDGATAAVVASVALFSIYGFHLRTFAFVALGVTGFLTLVALGRGYEPKVLGHGPTELQAMLRAGLVGAGLLMAFSYTTQAEISRLLVFVGIPVLVFVAAVVRYAYRQVLYRARSQGEAVMPTVVVGDAGAVARVVRDLARAPEHGYAVAGVCLPSIADQLPQQDVPVIGAVADIPQVVVDHGIEVVVVAGSHLSGEGLRRLSWALHRAGADLIVAPDLVEVTGPRLTLRPAAGLSLLEVEVGAPRGRMIAKAALDRTLGTLLLLVAAPVIGAAALAIRLTSPGPVFFQQTRVGVDGETFTMWKLRSMYIDAEARKQALLDRTDRDGPMFKMHSDPRITPVGRFLRRYSLDELPQLLNVVRGDMSLVGPRPPLVDEVALYHDEAHRRLHVRPGLTGLWQVSGRADLTWEESVRLDLRYVDNWSVAMDMTILWKTARAVFTGAGAY